MSPYPCVSFLNLSTVTARFATRIYQTATDEKTRWKGYIVKNGKSRLSDKYIVINHADMLIKRSNGNGN